MQWRFLTKKRPASLWPCSSPAGVQVKNTSLRSHRLEHLGRNTISPRTSTQAAPLTSSARGENRAHEFYTCFHFQGPWTVRLVVDDAPFLVLSHTPHGHCFRTIRAVPPLSVFGSPTGDFCEASRGSAALTGNTRIGVAVNGVIQEKAV